MMTKVSVLIPIYNVQEYLPKCLDTVLGQTYNNLQIVIIDDGSTDNSYEIAAKYANNDSRIELYRQSNQGVATTRNNLLTKIKGEHVLFVDSDDWLELDMIDFLMKKKNYSGADLITCGMVINDSPLKDEYIEHSYNQEEAIERFLYHKEFRGSLWNKLVDTSLLHNVRFHCGISYGEDALFCWHYLQNVSSVLYTNKQLYHYRMNKSSLSHSSFSQKKLTGHYVWEQICSETEQWWPQYLHIAKARHCIEDALLVRDAAHCGYNKKTDIEMLQNILKKYRFMLFKSDMTSLKMKLFVYLISISYWFASIV